MGYVAESKCGKITFCILFFGILIFYLIMFLNREKLSNYSKEHPMTDDEVKLLMIGAVLLVVVPIIIFWICGICKKKNEGGSKDGIKEEAPNKVHKISNPNYVFPPV